VPLEGFTALTGISGPQKFSIHRAGGSADRLPTAHTCFNQLDLPAYESAAQLKERLLLAIHEGATGFGFA
jgi:E3 ubiquitin-protein ligase HUWE1